MHARRHSRAERFAFCVWMAGLLALTAAIAMRLYSDAPPLGWTVAAGGVFGIAVLANVPLYVLLRKEGASARDAWPMMRPLFLAALIIVPFIAL